MPLLRILMLVDADALDPRLSTPTTPVWRKAPSEASIFATLEAGGYDVNVIPFDAPAMRTAERIISVQSQLVFNLTLHRDGDRRKAHEIAALLDVLDLPYTGAGPMGILRACDKAISKHLVQLAGHPVPSFLSVPVGELPREDAIAFPAIVKPRYEGGSLGIDAGAVAHDIRTLERNVAKVHRDLEQPAVCESFIPGREISIGLIGNADVFVFPIRERAFPHQAKGGPQFATYRVKNDARYRKQWNVHWRRARLPSQTARSFQARARSIYRELMLRDYAWLDFRLSRSGELFFLEANHLPDCGPHSFGMFADWCAVPFGTLLDCIIACCLKRHEQDGRLKPPLSTVLARIMRELGDARRLVR